MVFKLDSKPHYPYEEDIIVSPIVSMSAKQKVERNSTIHSTVERKQRKASIKKDIITGDT